MVFVSDVKISLLGHKNLAVRFNLVSDPSRRAAKADGVATCRAPCRSAADLNKPQGPPMPIESSNAAIVSLRYSAHPAYSKLTKLTKAELVS